MIRKIQILLFLLAPYTISAQCTDELLLQLNGLPDGRMGGGQVRAAPTTDGGQILAGTFSESENILVGDSLFTGTNGGGYGIFVIRTFADGSIAWANFYDGSGFNNVADVVVDDDGDSYLTGVLATGLIIEGTEYNGAALQSFYLLKLSVTGSLDWIKVEPTSFSGGKKLAIQNDLILVTGHFGHSLSVTGNILQASTQDGKWDTFLWAINSNGVHQWITIIGGEGTQKIESVTCNDSLCILMGAFETELKFGQELYGTTTEVGQFKYFGMAYKPSTDSVDWSISSSSEHAWIHSFEDIAIAGNNVYAYGRFREDLTFDQITLSSSGESDAFILKMLVDNGTVTIGRAIGGTEDDGPTDLITANNSIYALATSYSTFELDGQSIVNQGNADAVLFKFDDNLTTVCSKQFGGDSYDDVFSLLASNDSGPLFNVFGVSQGDFILDEMDAITQGFMDAFLWKTCLPCDTGVGIEEANPNEISLQVYPNPTTNQLNIKLFTSQKATAIGMLDMLGRELLHRPFATQLDVSHLPAGNYVLAVYTEGGVLRQKVVIE